MPQRLHLSYCPKAERDTLSFTLPLSKSLEARRLILRSVLGYPLGELESGQAEYAQDIYALHTALQALAAGEGQIDVKESGTAMRFMLALLSAKGQGAKTLCGQGRQHQRPIAPLVDALHLLGANISYLEEEGYPPLHIEPQVLKAKCITLNASSSSQYLSALMLIAPLVSGEGYEIDTRGYGLASRPYALMTMKQMQSWGYLWTENEGLFRYEGRTSESITTEPQSEADWSSASYAYLLTTLQGLSHPHKPQTILLPQLQLGSCQGDEARLLDTYARLGISTQATDKGLMLSTALKADRSSISLHCEATPDLVPALVASFVALGRAFTLGGVHHLRIKESDRLQALQTELAKVGVHLEVGVDSISWQGGEVPPLKEEEIPVLNPHQDHRIAMALAPLMAQMSPKGIIVEDADCVSKSFPNYWSEICNFGYELRTV